MSWRPFNQHFCKFGLSSQLYFNFSRQKCQNRTVLVGTFKITFDLIFDWPKIRDWSKITRFSNCLLFRFHWKSVLSMLSRKTIWQCDKLPYGEMTNDKWQNCQVWAVRHFQDVSKFNLSVIVYKTTLNAQSGNVLQHVFKSLNGLLLPRCLLSVCHCPNVFQLLLIASLCRDVGVCLICQHQSRCLIYYCCCWNVSESFSNGTAHFKKCQQLLEYQNLLLLRNIWCSRLWSIFKCCSFFQHQC